MVTSKVMGSRPFKLIQVRGVAEVLSIRHITTTTSREGLEWCCQHREKAGKVENNNCKNDEKCCEAAAS